MPPLIKQAVPINFSQGMDTKTDPFQVSTGKFLSLSNSTFDEGGALRKRNGFAELASISNSTAISVATFSSSLLAVGDSLQSFSGDINRWYNKGIITPLSISVTPGVRNNSSQLCVDVAVAPNGLACACWTDLDTYNYYQIFDSVTGDVVVPATQLPGLSTAGSVPDGIGPGVTVLGNYFILLFLEGTSSLQYIAVPVNNPANPVSPVTISSVALVGGGYDFVVANNNLYISWMSSGTVTLKVTYIDSTLQQHNTISGPAVATTGRKVSVAADTSGSSPIIWVTWTQSVNKLIKTMAFDQSLTTVLAATSVLDTTPNAVTSLVSTANAGVLTVFYTTFHDYTYAVIRSDLTSKITCTQAGVVGSASVLLRGVDISSKAIYSSERSKSYLVVTYCGAFQPTNFLIDDSGNILSKFAYSNAVFYQGASLFPFGAYTTFHLPTPHLNGDVFQVGYLFKSTIQPVNKTQQSASPTPGVYSLAGINLATFTFDSQMATAELGNNLHLSGGFLWMYDGIKPVEHGFHLWPEDLFGTTATTGGSMTAQVYYYVATYEWTDGQGNIHRSAPSIPTKVDCSGSGTSTNANTVNVPYYRVTYKTGTNPVRIVIYRWSASQPVYYQVTSIVQPQTNNTAADSLAFVDILADSSTFGNTILYTTGGVVENIAPPALTAITPFGSRLFGISAEDGNTLFYSKTVIEDTPVEMSDLFTLFVAPTISAHGNTGVGKCLFALDDKLIIFKKEAVYYETGKGPDNTGANNDYSDPTFITGTVGCDNQNSIVFIPSGLMFQSDKGIWLLGRDLSTRYIGAPVEAYNDATVLSALTVPGTNQVRFTLDNGITLMYDYYYDQWGTFLGVPGISSTLYQNRHTFINTFGELYQENPGSYLDGDRPVLMGFTTSWLNLAGLQGYERIYYFQLLGTYLSPHMLRIQVAMDYNPAPSQAVTLTPDNFSSAYGADPLYGSSSNYGGSVALEHFRVFMSQQKCTSFQITLQEIFDSSKGVAAGAGFTLSGLNLVTGIKKRYKPTAAKYSAA